MVVNVCCGYVTAFVCLMSLFMCVQERVNFMPVVCAHLSRELIPPCNLALHQCLYPYNVHCMCIWYDACIIIILILLMVVMH